MYNGSMSTYNFITGPAGTGKTEYIYETLTRRALEQPEKKFFLFVPEQNTLKAQQEIIRHSEVNGMLNLDVLSMSLLSYRVLEELDMKAPELLDEVSKTMLLRKTLSEVKGDLLVYARKTESPGFIVQIKKIITEFGQYGVRPETLRSAAEGKESGLIGAKLHDVALILEKFYENLHREDGKAIPEELPGILLKHFGDSRLLDGAVIVFDSFTGFTPVQLDVLAEIIRRSETTSIAFSIPKSSKSKKNGHFSDQFWFPRMNINKIIDRMSLEGISHAEDIETDGNFSKEPVRTIHYAGDPVEEISFIAEDILKKAVVSGTRYRRMALCLSDPGSYREIIRREFAERRIPFFMDDNADGNTSPVTGVLRAALRLILNGYEFEDMITYLRNLYITDRSERETLDRFENYLRETGRSGRKKYEEDWTQASFIPEETDILTLEEYKSRKLAEVFSLHDSLKAGKTAGEKAAAVERFLGVIFGVDPGEDIDTQTDRIAEESGSEEGKTDMRFLKMLFAMTDRIRDLLGDETMTLRPFLEMVEAGLSEMKAGMIPATLDCVMVGDLKRSRLDGIDVLYIVGANEGKIPSSVTGGGIFTDAERQELMAANVNMAPDDRRDASVQEYYLYLTEHKPGRDLIITYPLTDREGKGLNRSSHIKEKGTRIPYGEKVFPACPAEEYTHRPETLSPETADVLFGGTLHGSVTSAESYRRCPFSYFAGYGLRLKERKGHDIESPDLGLVYHAALDSAFRKLTKEKRSIAKVSDTELELIADRVVGKAVNDYKGQMFLSDARSRYISGEILRTVKRTLKTLAMQERSGSFEVLATEKNFSVKDRNLDLSGKIDRIDTARSPDGGQTFVNVIDYKSGAREPDLSAMYDGLDMQLATYLKEAVRIVEETGKPEGTVLPAGMYYYHVTDPIVNDGDDPQMKMAMKGLTVSDADAVSATDRAIYDSGEASYVNGLKYNAGKDTFTGGTVVKPEVMDALLEHTRDVMKKDAERILSGEINVHPYRFGEKTGCDYCRYAALCGLDRRLPGYPFRQVEKKTAGELEEEVLG